MKLPQWKIWFLLCLMFVRNQSFKLYNTALRKGCLMLYMLNFVLCLKQNSLFYLISLTSYALIFMLMDVATKTINKPIHSNPSVDSHKSKVVHVDHGPSPISEHQLGLCGGFKEKLKQWG